MSKNSIKLPKEIFDELYHKFDGHTWYMQRVLNRLYETALATIEIADVELCIAAIVESEKEIYQRLIALLTRNQCQLLIAIAKEGCANAINSSAFVQRYHLKNASSISRAIDTLLSQEFVMKTQEGYIVYDRFMALYLKGL